MTHYIRLTILFAIITVIVSCQKEKNFSTDPLPVSNIETTGSRISNITYYNPVTNSSHASITSFYNASNRVKKIQLIDSFTRLVLHEFNLSYSADRIQVHPQQYFTIDQSGRIKQFHGYLQPTDITSPRVSFTYTYNTAGYMIQSVIAADSLGDVPAMVISYEWTGGNLSRVVIQQSGSTERTEIGYQYDLSRPATNFLCFFPNSEIILFQGAVNFGRNSTHVIVKSTIRHFDGKGNLSGTQVADFSRYSFDADNQVKSFLIMGDGAVYDAGVKYVLSYKKR
jgi:hypothetical protein